MKVLLSLAVVMGLCSGNVVWADLQVTPVTAQELLREVRQAQAKAVLVNVWATWCLPCVEEFPDLVRLEKDYRSEGLKVFFVSADAPSQLDQVKAFLEKHQVDYPSYLKTGDDMEFIEALLPEWSGAIPATFLFDETGALRRFRKGQGDYAFFSEMVKSVLDSDLKSEQ